MLKLGYQGESYDIREATNEAAIGDVRELLKASGISVRNIGQTLIGMEEMDSLLEVYDTVDRLDFFAGTLFLCLRKAGRRDFMWQDALAVPLSDISLIIDVPDTEEGEGDPKAPDQSTHVEPDGGETKTS